MKQSNISRQISLFLVFLLTPLITSGEVIQVAGSGWCPYICIDPASDNGFAENPGAFTEVVISIVAKAGHSLKLTTIPWSRAIFDTRAGKYNAVFGSAKSITPDFVFPTIPQSLYNMCFHTRINTNWKYFGVNSLEDIRLGVVQDYPYDDGGPVDNYIKQNANYYHIQTLKGDDRSALRRNIQKLVTKRIDAIIDSPFVVSYMLQKIQLTDQLKVAGCLKTGEMYIAFSPALKTSLQYAQLISDGMVNLKQSGKLLNILKKYGFKEWE